MKHSLALCAFICSW